MKSASIMTGQNLVILKMEKIREIFLNSKNFASRNHDLGTIDSFLKRTDTEFRSVGYEAVAMELAIRDLVNGDDNLSTWRSFMGMYGQDHASQIHSGLGWAISQENRSALPFLDTLHPFMRYRILDGAGYYDGTFRKRQALVSKKIPEGLHGVALKTYFQGIGRSVWYTSTGEIEKVGEIIQSFDNQHHENLWRGIGIAVNYVGGCNENMLKQILSSALGYQPQLLAGLALAGRSRMLACAITSDLELACQVWCGLSAKEMMVFTEKVIPISVNNRSVYGEWIDVLETELGKKNSKEHHPSGFKDHDMPVMA